MGSSSWADIVSFPSPTTPPSRISRDLASSYCGRSMHRRATRLSAVPRRLIWFVKTRVSSCKVHSGTTSQRSWTLCAPFPLTALWHATPNGSKDCRSMTPLGLSAVACVNQLQHSTHLHRRHRTTRVTVRPRVVALHKCIAEWLYQHLRRVLFWSLGLERCALSDAISKKRATTVLHCLTPWIPLPKFFHGSSTDWLRPKYPQRTSWRSAAHGSGDCRSVGPLHSSSSSPWAPASSPLPGLLFAARSSIPESTFLVPCCYWRRPSI